MLILHAGLILADASRKRVLLSFFAYQARLADFKWALSMIKFKGLLIFDNLLSKLDNVGKISI